MPRLTTSKQHHEQWSDSQACVSSCDGIPESVVTLAISVYITDNCDDNYPLVYRFFNRTSGKVWPTEGDYETEGIGVKTITELSCTLGNKICPGGATDGGGGNVLGVGLDGTLPDGEDWCLQCGMSYLEGWGLGCW